MTDGTRPSSPGGDGEGPAGPPILDAVNQPTLPSAGMALVVVLVVLLLLADGEASVAVLWEAGLLTLVVAASVLEETTPGLTLALQVAGALGALVVVAVATRTVDSVVALVEVLPGMVGFVLVALAVFPRTGLGSRRLLKLGSGALLLTVLVSGVLRAATLDLLVVAALGSVLVWDVGEQAICLGEHLGRRASTRRLEVVHAVSGGLVAGVGALAALTVRDLGTPGLPLHSFLLLVVAVLAFAVALYD